MRGFHLIVAGFLLIVALMSDAVNRAFCSSRSRVVVQALLYHDAFSAPLC